MDRLTTVGSMLTAFNRKRFDLFAEGFTPEGSLEFPQSGESISGREAIAEMYSSAPSTPRLEAVSLRQAGGLVIADLVPDYGDGSSWTAVLLFEFEGGLVSRQTAYFGAPFDPPAWRRPFDSRSR